jgi:hypothetical protein
MINRETLEQMRLAAEMADDYSVYKREMARVRQLEAQLRSTENTTETTGDTTHEQD